MAKKNKSPYTVDEWMTEIDNGLEYRRIFAREDSWAELEQMYLNDPHSACAIGPNLIFSMGDSLLSALVVPDPELVVTPTDPQSAQQSPLVESVSNRLVKTMDLKEQVELACLHAYLYGVGILKLGYDSEFGYDPRYDLGGPLDPVGMTLTQFNARNATKIESGIARPGQPWVKAVSPHDIVVPWGTKTLESAPWIAHRVIRRTSDIKVDPKYKNTARLEPQCSMEQFLSSYDKSSMKRHVSWNLSQFNANNTETFNELWEIHDLVSGRIYTIATDYTEFLRDDIDAIQVIGAPFVGGGFIRHPRTFWTTPQAYYLAQIQVTQSDIALQAEKQRRISQIKFITDDQSLSDDELTKLLSSDVGGVVRAKSMGQDLRNIIVPAPQGSSLDLVYHADVNRRYARDAVGLSNNQLGEFDTSSRRTATESQIVQLGSQNRQAHRLDILQIFYIQTIRKVMGLVSRFWFMPQMARVNDSWVYFTGADLQGTYSYDMHLSNKRHISSYDRTFEALQLLGMMAQYPGANLQAIEGYLGEIARDPRFATFFLSNAQKAGMGGVPSSITTQQQASLMPPNAQGAQGAAV